MTALLLLALTLAASPPQLEEKPRNSLSLEVPSLLWNGFELVGERFVSPRFSVLIGLGGRFAGGGDFSGNTLSAGVGARFWLNRFQLFTDLGGPVLGLRVDTAWTRIAARQRATVLSTVSTALSLRLGYRFVIVRRFELTPEAGLAVSMGLERLPRLAVVPRPGLVLGLTLGYLF